MTILIIIAISLVCGIGGGLFALMLSGSRDRRDGAAQARDYGLAEIYRARAGALALETNHKRAEASRLREWQREQSRKRACNDAREEKK